MSNGERSAATIMGVAKQKIKAGQEVRLVNIPVKRLYGAWDDLHGLTGDTAGAAFSDAIRKAAESNYGHAGRAFLEKLVEDKRDWPQALAQYRATEELGAQSGDGQDQRVAARFALIALAGEVATEYGMLPWPPGTAALAAATISRETYGERVGGNNEPQQIIDQVVAFIDREESGFEPDYSPLVR
jgi:putative DNA primase/helicase